MAALTELLQANSTCGNCASQSFLAFVDDHSQHLGHFVVNVLHTTVIAQMAGAGGDFSNTKKLIYDV